MQARARLAYLGSIVLAFLAPSPAVRAQCAAWVPGYVRAGCDELVGALTVFDDGSGPVLYAGGGFRHAGPLTTNALARWTGAAWTALPQVPDNDVYDMAVHDDGSGPALFVVGHFTHVGALAVNHSARWDGATWSALGSGTVFEPATLAVYDDGSGPALYAGGYSPTGSTLSSYVAKWDGTSWSLLGAGVDGSVWALAVHDDGGGPALYAGGDFLNAGGAPAARVARWNGSAWSALGSGVDGSVHALASFDDGSGPALYAGGAFSQAGTGVARSVARWRSSAWTEVGGGLADPSERNVFALRVHDDGSGPALYATGSFAQAGAASAKGLARWNGSAWSAVGAGFGSGAGYALESFDEGSGPRLFVGGSFEAFGDGAAADDIARWNGATLSNLGPSNAPNGSVEALAAFDDGTGPRLIVAGSFTAVGDVAARRIASYDGTIWAPLGAGLNGGASVLAIHDDGAGPALYAGGSFTEAGGVPALRVARWDGTAWQGLGAGPGLTEVRALCSYDSGSGPLLYAAGRDVSAFQTCVKRWNGSSWSSVGCFGPVPLLNNPLVYDLAVYDAGAGPRLAATGQFRSIVGGPAAANIASYDGLTWSALGAGLTSPPFLGVDYSLGLCLQAFDDGGGPALYVGGSFATAGSVPAQGLARWSGGAWSDVGGSTNGQVNDLALHDDGTGAGTALVATGIFTSVGALPAARIAAWRANAWHAFGAGIGPANATPRALGVGDDGTSADLYVGGNFDSAGGLPSFGFARWRGCGETGESVCLGDGSGTACPCGNASAPSSRSGCLNSFGLGAALRASGVASITADTLTLRASGLPSMAPTLFAQGTETIAGGSVFGDGLRCAGGQVRRLGTRSASGGTALLGRDVPGDPRLHASGQIRTAGVRRTYQAWYRNAANYCTVDTFNLSNAVSITWAP